VDALELHANGLDFADALHWCAAAKCSRFVTFDDRGFARRAKRIKRFPEVVLPGAV
jgi:predicted nucleic acid-binding protein